MCGAAGPPGQDRSPSAQILRETGRHPTLEDRHLGRLLQVTYTHTPLSPLISFFFFFLHLCVCVCVCYLSFFHSFILSFFLSFHPFVCLRGGGDIGMALMAAVQMAGRASTDGSRVRGTGARRSRRRPSIRSSCSPASSALMAPTAPKPNKQKQTNKKDERKKE